MFILILLLLIDVDSNVVAFTSSPLNQIRTTRNSLTIQPHNNLILYTTTTTTTTTTKAVIKSKKIINIPIPFSFKTVIQNDTKAITATASHPKVVMDRFDRTASQIRHMEEPCILTIDNTQYNLTSWGTYERTYHCFYFRMLYYILSSSSIFIF
jgi:hypothetical protein